MRNIILALIFLLNTLTINAQNEIDALRYSMTDLSGSARLLQWAEHLDP